MYRVVAEYADDVIVLHDADGTRLYVSPACRRILGWEPDDLAHLPAERFVHPEDAPVIAALYTTLGPERPEFRSTHRLRHRDGHYVWVEALIRLIPGAQVRGASIVATVRDVTARIAAEAALRRSEAQFRLLADSTTDLIIRHDRDGNRPYVSPACRRILGYEPEELMPIAGEELVHPDDLPRARAAARALSPDQPEAAQTYRMRHRNGTYVWMDATMRLITEPMEDGAQIVSTMRDVTARKQAEDALRISEGRYRTLADHSTDMICLENVDRSGLYVSPASIRMLGYEPHEMIAMTAADLVHADDLEHFMAARFSVSPDHLRARSVHRMRRRDGSLIWAEAALRWIEATTDEPPRILTVVRDVTERKLAEEAAQRLQALLSDAIESMEDGIAIFDRDDRLLLTNSTLRSRPVGAGNLYVPGRSYEEILRIYWSADHFDTPERREAFIAAALERHRRGDGTPSESKNLDGEWHLNRHFRTRDGGILTVSTEITALKRAAEELEAARDAATSASQAKSAFLASMSHEIRTPMNGVIGFADLLLDTELTAEQRRHATMLRDAGRSLLAIINDILDLSKIEAGKMEIERVPLSPASVVDGAISILRSQVEAKGLTIATESDPDIPAWIAGDPTRLRQILLNLLSNALKFTETGGITVRAGRLPASAEGAPERLRIEVADTGIGIAADRLHLLFQDFTQIDRSTTRRYGGTGLGLSICKRLVELMGGDIGVASDPGQGSRFWFTLPMVATGAPVAEPGAPAASTSAARILVAEDLAANQIIVKAMLNSAGHSVMLVGNGLEALQAVQEEAYDLVLMDMEMPEMDGLSATEAIRRLVGSPSDVPIIALTANAMINDWAACKAAGMNDFLAKPINRNALLSAVARWTAPGKRIDLPR
jgi:PAS domain S-box-containing protein